MSNLRRSDGVVAIRPYEERDEDELLDASTESVAEIGPWLPWCHVEYGREDAREWIALTRAQLETEDAYHLAVVEAETDRLLGGVGLGPILRLHRIANLGYWVRTSAAGRGVATRATLLAARLGVALGLTRLEIVAAVGNRASQRVAEKAGAVREGVLRNRLLIHGELHDAVSYSLIPGDGALGGPGS